MTATPTTATAGRLDVGDTWLLGVDVRDDDTGALTDASLVATVTLPDGSTTSPAVELVTTGVYRTSHVLAVPGRHTARLASTGTVTSVVVFAVTAVEVTAPPTVEEVTAYLGSAANDWTGADIAAALAAEMAAQSRACRIPATYPPDLAEALKRRVARNLAIRGLPLGLQTSMSEATVATTRIGRDPEIRAKEAPWRKGRVG